MRVLSLVSLLLLVAVVAARSNVHRTAALTDQLGQEVIEIPGPIRDLPQGVDEEPAPENDLMGGGETIAVKTTTESQLVYVMNRTRRVRGRGGAGGSGGAGADDEEARVQKELDEVYKDEDYKNDPTSAATTQPPTSTPEAPPTTPPEADSTTHCANCTDVDAIMEEIYQPDEDEAALLRANIGRSNTDEFQFQPRDARDPAEVARFRTSVDDVTCDRRQRGSDAPEDELVTTDLPTKKNASAIFVNIFLILSALLSLILR